MNAALSVILSLTTVLAGGAAALGGDLLSPHSVPTDDCVAGVCLGGHGNETSEPGNETGAQNGTADSEPDAGPEPEPEPQGNQSGHYHHHHYHNETGNGTAEPEADGPEDVHFCTTGLFVLGDGYTFTWDVHDGYESFHLDWHFQPLALGLASEPDLRIELLDGAGNVVLSADGDDARSFSLDTDDLRGHAAGEWSFTVASGELVGEQGLVGSVEY